jgi:pyruvate ferredoxin oxidoreductase gamma subunit
MFQVRFHGRGGQGVVTAAELLASAAFREDRYAQAFPSFGSERMGAPVMSFCRIDDKPIRTREPVAAPDALLIQDPTLLHQAGLLDGLRPDGYVLVNSSRGVDDIGLAEFAAQHFAAQHRGHLLTVPATNLALANLGRPLPGAPMLGGLAALTRTEQTVSLEALLAAITDRFADRPRVAAGNSAAARAAFDFVTGELDELKAVTHHA